MIYPKLTASVLSLFCLLSCGFTHASEQPEEIVITGRIPGPPLWQVRNGDNVLWIFGLLTPLPPRLELDTSRLEAVLDDADEVLDLPDFDFNESFGPVKLLRLYSQFRKVRVNADGKSLQQVLPEELYQRLLANKARYGPRSDKMLKMRPLLAAEYLEGAALKKVGLQEDADVITKQVKRAIRQHSVPVTEVVYSSDMSVSSMMDALAQVPFEAEVACLRSMLDSLENDLDLLKERAEAWAYGQMGQLYATSAYGGAKTSCFRAISTPASLQEVNRQTRQLWLTHAERALTANRNTFALLDIRAMLSEEGLLNALRERGYEVTEPDQVTSL